MTETSAPELSGSAKAKEDPEAEMTDDLGNKKPQKLSVELKG